MLEHAFEILNAECLDLDPFKFLADLRAAGEDQTQTLEACNHLRQARDKTKLICAESHANPRGAAPQGARRARIAPNISVIAACSRTSPNAIRSSERSAQLGTLFVRGNIWASLAGPILARTPRLRHGVCNRRYTLKVLPMPEGPDKPTTTPGRLTSKPVSHFCTPWRSFMQPSTRIDCGLEYTQLLATCLSAIWS
jgi:hypothetical protein